MSENGWLRIGKWLIAPYRITTASLFWYTKKEGEDWQMGVRVDIADAGSFEAKGEEAKRVWQQLIDFYGVEDSEDLETIVP
jgi:hypothetical protein